MNDIKPQEPLFVKVENYDIKQFKRITDFIDQTGKMPEMIMIETNNDLETNKGSFSFYILC